MTNEIVTVSVTDSVNLFNGTTASSFNNMTEAIPGVYVNHTDSVNQTDTSDNQSNLSHETMVTVAVATSSVVFVIIIIVIVVCFVKKRYHKKKTKAWVDNLTLSYIADSNIDLTKDTYDEMISLDNDNFLNSLDSHSFSVFSPDSNTRQYAYSYF